MLRLLPVLVVLTARPALACEAPPPESEVVANDKATIAPDGGVIVTLDQTFGGAEELVELRADGARLYNRLAIAYGLSVIQVKPRTKTLEVLRSGKVVKTLTVGPAPVLAAPKLLRVSSTATRGASPSKMYAPVAKMTIELGAAAPADAFTLVIYKVDRAGARSVAYGTPDAKRAVTFSTGGKRCRGGFETLFPGERISVAWLDVHGRISQRSPDVAVQ